MNESVPALLAVVEVKRDQAVACQAAGCNHRVYRAIHVVRTRLRITVLGSTCFRKLYEATELAKAKPHYTGTNSRRLTDEERQLLQHNADALVQRFESEHTAQEQLRASAQPRQYLQPQASASAYRSTQRHRLSRADPLLQASAELLAEAKSNIAARYGCDPDLPGWRGLLIAEIQALLRRDAA
jgi:Lon protease-like protein